MKNKFEALKAFQAWPREWQELCAEFLASDGELAQQRCTATSMQAAKTHTIIRYPLECIDQDKMQLGPGPARRAAAKRPVLHFMRYTRSELESIDLHLKNGYRPLETARLMDRKRPKHRTIDAWEKMVHKVKKHGLKKMLESAIDMEVK